MKKTFLYPQGVNIFKKNEMGLRFLSILTNTPPTPMGFGWKEIAASKYAFHNYYFIKALETLSPEEAYIDLTGQG